MVELLEAAASDISVQYGANVTGKLTWKNIALEEGTPLVAAFFLGKGGSIYVFTYQGVEYIIGSIVTVSAPSMGATITTDIPSKAAFYIEGEDPTVWDAQAMIGVTTGEVRTMAFDGRIVGLNRADIDAGHLGYYDAAWSTGILSVAAPAKAAEVSSFEFVAG
jgi:hypothetical protein